MLKANNPALSSWIAVSSDSDFPIQNIPFGVFKTAEKSPRVATIIGDTVIDLAELAKAGYFSDLEVDAAVFSQMYINDFMALGKTATRAVRDRISDLFEKNNTELAGKTEVLAKVLHNVNEVELLLPVQVGDYTDFYSSREHATNVGTMFRDPDNALLPNWLHLPVGYHGRASSIVVSGTEIHRPKGQQRPDDSQPPVYGPCKLLDFELEMAFVVGQSTKMGQSISTAEADDYIFGLALFNDWSARDIQKWEYVPLGPFLAKNFASTVSPWIVTLDALEPFRTEGYEQDPEVLPYLKYEGKKNYDIKLQVAIQPNGGEEKVVCNSNFKHMYWTMTQQLAHHTVNGCNVNVGDMCASGTISGPTPDSYGSMLEISWRGTKPVDMPDGTQRRFINDGDTVIMRGWGEVNGLRIGFGECTGKLLPAL
ncbi:MULTISPECIES: fumarylacetoacetase [unclassified Aureispira]|uniref:fumarylacetoacetase n=1 Tax=unclassified Aureispira TaxID=2649989 RepID=UPI000698373E|nr:MULTISPECIES: fumarylacetoacetase [unclassified Aureispira]WMX15015.1 fumarylacetoacetase [Aureispira sp. CCB-E]